MSIHPARFPWKPMAVLVLANLLWTTSYAVSKQVMDEIPPITLTFWKCFLPALVMWPGRKGRWPAARHDWVVLLSIGMFGVLASTTLLTVGLKHTLSANTALLASLEPVLAVGLAALLLGEAMSRRIAFCLMIGLGGAVLLSVGDGAVAEVGGSSAFGNALVLGSTVMFAMHTVLSRAVVGHVDPRVLMFVPFFVATVCLIPFLEAPLLPRTVGGWIGLSYLSILSVTIGYALWNWGLKRVTTGQAALTLYLQPLGGGLVGALVMKEQLPPLFPVSAALIVSSLVLMNLPVRAEARVLDEPTA